MTAVTTGGYIQRAAVDGSVSASSASSSSKNEMGFKQLFDDDSSTYTYLLWDQDTKDALLIDPVDIQVDRDLNEVKSLGLNLVYGMNTHAHADHITGTGLLKKRVEGLQSVISASSKADADIHISHGDEIHFGSHHIVARATPGHTEGCLSYVAEDASKVFTGDTLLIQGCGRTYFQGGSSSNLYDSVHTQLFTLPDTCVVYPAHDYKGRASSVIGKEKTDNPRLGKGKTKSDFVQIMSELKLSYPKHIDRAVPANMICGVPDAE
jgi:sulfur dioxygenase